MKELLLQLNKHEKLIPKRFYFWDSAYLVFTNFIVPFSRDIDFEFSELESISFYIKKYINNNTNQDSNILKYIYCFDYKMYLYSFYKNIEFNKNGISSDYFDDIVSYYKVLLDETEYLVFLFKEFAQKKND